MRGVQRRGYGNIIYGMVWARSGHQKRRRLICPNFAITHINHPTESDMEPTIRIVGKRVILNAVWNWLSFALHVVITFFLTPYVISRVGPTGYGIWALANGLTGYYGLVDLGLRAGLTQLVTHMVAERKRTEIASTISAAWLGLIVMAALILLCVVPIVAYASPTWFRLDAYWGYQMRWAVVVLGATFCAQLVLFPFGTVLPAMQRYDLSAIISVVSRLGFLLANVIVLSLWPTLVGLSLVFGASTVFEYIIRAIVARWLLPEFTLTLRQKAGAGRTVVSYTAWNAILTLAGKIQLHTGLVVLGLLRPPTEVAAFAVASRLVDYLMKNIDVVSRVFFPTMAHVSVDWPQGRTARFVASSSKAATLATLWAAASGWVCGGDFLRLWLGEKSDTEGLPLRLAAVVLCLLLAGTAFSGWRSIAWQYLLARKYLRPLALMALMEAISHLVLAGLLGYYWGPVGIALSVVLPGFVFGVCVQQYFVLQQLGVGAWHWIRAVWLPVAAVSGIMAAGVFAGSQLPAAHTWADLFARGLLFEVATLPVVWIIGLNRNDRQHLAAIAGEVWRRRSIKPTQKEMAPAESIEEADSVAKMANCAE